MMRVLWFANTPCGSREKLDPQYSNAGWLVSLERAIVKSPGIELHVAFYWGKQVESFVYKNVTYYPIYRKSEGSKIKRLIQRYKKRVNDNVEIPLLLDVVKKIQPDIIHVHGTEENFGLIQYHSTIPTVVSIQGILNSILYKMFSGIPLDIARKFEGTIAKLVAKSFSLTYRLFYISAQRESNILSHTKHIIGRTDWDKRVTRVLAPGRKYYIGNEILRSTFYDIEWKKQTGSTIFKIATTIGEGIYKGLETIVNTAKILKKYSEINFEWIVVGITSESQIARIIRKWLRVEYEKYNIKLLGNKSEIELATVLSTSDIYCQVSRIENSSNSLCEAMMIGMPCIASFAGGTDSIIENRVEGILVQEGDPFSFAGAILELYDDNQLAVRYGKAAKNKALERHNPAKVVQELIAVYEKIR